MLAVDQAVGEKAVRTKFERIWHAMMEKLEALNRCRAYLFYRSL